MKYIIYDEDLRKVNNMQKKHWKRQFFSKKNFLRKTPKNKSPKGIKTVSSSLALLNWCFHWVLSFLVVYTRLHKSLCRSVGPSICPLLSLYFFPPKGDLTSVTADVCDWCCSVYGLVSNCNWVIWRVDWSNIVTKLKFSLACGSHTQLFKSVGRSVGQSVGWSCSGK